MLYFLYSFFSIFILVMNSYYFNFMKLLSFFMMWLLIGAIMISSISFLEKKSKIWLFSLMIIMMSFFSKTLIVFYMYFELSLIPILLLILYKGNQPERLSASLYFLIYTSLVSIPFIVFVVILNTKNLNWFSFFDSSLLFMFISLLPFLIKMPVFGGHFWLPKAHVEANTSGSMILAGVLLKLGSYGFVRIIFLMKNIQLAVFSGFWMMLSLFSSFTTFLQSDIKKLVAYSSVTHMTFMLVGLNSINSSMVLIFSLLSLAHGWASMALFASAGATSGAVSSRLSMFLSSEYKFNWFLIFLGLMLMTNASLPPLPSFFSEVLIVKSILMISPLTMIFIFVSLFVCYYNVLIYLFMGHHSSYETSMNFMSSENYKFSFLFLMTVNSIFCFIKMS